MPTHSLLFATSVSQASDQVKAKWEMLRKIMTDTNHANIAGQQNARNLIIFLAARDILVVIGGGLALLLGLFSSIESSATTSSNGTEDKCSSSIMAGDGHTNTTRMCTRCTSRGSASGTHARSGLICALYLLILGTCIACYFIEYDTSRSFTVLVVRLVTDWCYALVTQAWCVAWIFFASFRAARLPPVKQQCHVPANGASSYLTASGHVAACSSPGVTVHQYTSAHNYDRYAYLPPLTVNAQHSGTIGNPPNSSAHIHFYAPPNNMQSYSR